MIAPWPYRRVLQPVRSCENRTMALRGRRSPTRADGLAAPSYRTSDFNRFRYNAAFSRTAFCRRQGIVYYSNYGYIFILPILTPPEPFLICARSYRLGCYSATCAESQVFRLTERSCYDTIPISGMGGCPRTERFGKSSDFGKSYRQPGMHVDAHPSLCGQLGSSRAGEAELVFRGAGQAR